MNIFIAGGAGYIGSTVSSKLIEDGHSVTIYDSLIKGHKKAINKKAHFVKGDIKDEELLNSLFNKNNYDAVFHFAAYIEAGESMSNPGKFFDNNVTGSISLINSAVNNNIKKFIFSSTAGIYDSKNEPIKENDPIKPSSVYGQTKLIVESILESYSKTHNLKYAALRYFNAAGAVTSFNGEAHNPETHLIPLVLQVALNLKKEILIFGNDYPTPDGTCIRDYIHVKDLTSAHIMALNTLDSKKNMTYNIGNGNGYSVKEIIDTARIITGHSIPAKIAPRRKGDAPILIANSSLIRKELGWTPEIPDLKDIIATAWEWHKKNPNGYN